MRTPEEVKMGLVGAMAETFWVAKDGDVEDLQDACDMAHDSLADAFVYIEQLEAQIPRWIPVEERLPEDDQAALVICRDGYITTMTFGYERWWWQGTEDDSVTHWMPLPEAPKED